MYEWDYCQMDYGRPDFESIEEAASKEFYDVVILDEIRKRMPILFVTQGSSSCGSIVALLGRHHINYYLLEYDASSRKVFENYGVRETPTLMTPKGREYVLKKAITQALASNDI